MADPNGSSNAQREDGHSREAFEHLDAIGRIGGNTWLGANGDDSSDRAKVTEPPYAVERHPEDPPNALANAAREICDPEDIRLYAHWLGKSCQAIDPEWFEWLVRPLYRSVHEVRAGAIVISAQREAGEQLKISAGTSAAVESIRAQGDADGEKADRLESEVVPRIEKELTEATQEVERSAAAVAAAHKGVDQAREDAEERLAQEEGDRSASPKRRRFRRPAGNLFGRISLSPAKLWAAFLAEVTASTFLLAPSAADIADMPLEFGVLIALAISVTVLAASVIAGVAVAATRLPGWLAGLLMLGVYALILVKFVPGLDALRETEESGLGALSAATLAACFLASFGGYMMASRDDLRDALESDAELTSLMRRAGTPLGEALERLDEAKQDQQQAKEDQENLKRDLANLWEQIEQLRDSASRTTAREKDREQEGIEAKVAQEVIRATANAGVSQERAAAKWASDIAILSHEKTRIESPPSQLDVVQVGGDPGPTSGQGSDRLSGLQGAALATLGASGVGSLALGPVVLGVGIPVAALLAFLDRRPRGGSDRVPRPPGADEPPRRPSIVPAAAEDSQLYVKHPDRLVPKHEDGGAAPSERQ